ncbi:HD-GYP domain-containing protein [Alteromonas gilva]|uniref:HD-GYP domain-containing protein n=1 Tax=Alteromonas gilva TaxID=2987522 RepID=A0ABT5KWQ0_9ALTE|nr:HD-GYP domain-containing protein [Alteromonas gilva]MDC8829186.1 HD-GYP domain-containing protein [Alteromonas gilva]
MTTLTIGIDKLEVGMFVLKIAEQKAGAVQIKTRGRVTSLAIIEELKRKGVKRVVIETEASAAGASSEVVKPDVVQDVHNRVPLAEELRRAERLYRKGLDIQASLYDAVDKDKPFDESIPNEFARALVGSLNRNPDALLLLSRIREKDTYLLEHSLNVGILSANFSRFLGLPEEQVVMAAYSGMLHDLGKIKIPDHILHKPGRLTADEMEIMKQHVTFGVDFLTDMKIDNHLIRVVSEHHERLDGLGYPAQKPADDISFNGRLLAITDMYDALTADRCYKAGMSSQKALNILLQDSETKLDKGLLQQFIKCMGIYPMGSLVELSNQKIAIVMKQNPSQPLQPVVKVFYTKIGNHYVTPKDIDLSKDNKVAIERSVVASDYDLDINRFFNQSISL